MAFACRAYSFVFAEMREVTLVACASQACSYSFEVKLKVVPPATAKESPSAFQACSFAFAEEKAAAPRIVWTTMAALAYSCPAGCPSVFGSQNSFGPVPSSFLMLPSAGASQASSSQPCSYPTYLSYHASLPASYARPFSLALSLTWILPSIYSSPACWTYRVVPKQGRLQQTAWQRRTM